MTPPKRLQTATERDIVSDQARRERAKSPPVEYIDDDEDLTGKYDGEELLEMREQRRPEARIRHLEKNFDEHKSETNRRLGKVEVAVADLGGQMKIIPDLVGAMKDATSALRQREHLTLTTKLEVEKAEAIAEVTVDQAEGLDAIDARKAKRDTWLKIVAAAIGGGAVGKLFHLLGLL